MAAIIKDLGIATAYGYAKSKGYTGTEEEFAELMASYADVAQTAQEAAEQAIAAKEDAEDAASEAASSATSASGSASTATTKAGEASQSATSAAGSATTATTKAGEAATSASTASTKAGEAGQSATSAENNALKAEGYAIGKQNGTDVPSTSPYYENNAKHYAESAEQSAQDAQDVLDSIPQDYTQLSNDVSNLKSANLLNLGEIPDTVQSIAFDGSGNVQSITHKKRTDQSVTVRTDAFVFAGSTITEVRTLDTGETLTIVTDTDTLVTTVTYAAA